MSNTFFRVNNGKLEARVLESNDWEAIPISDAGSQVGKSVTMRVRESFSVDDDGALAIEKDPEHENFSAYWERVRKLTEDAITEMESSIKEITALENAS